jgi:hypothetical protein
MNAENANNPESEKSQDSDSWFNYKKIISYNTLSRLTYI